MTTGRATPSASDMTLRLFQRLGGRKGGGPPQTLAIFCVLVVMVVAMAFMTGGPGPAAGGPASKPTPGADLTLGMV